MSALPIIILRVYLAEKKVYNFFFPVEKILDFKKQTYMV